MGQEAVRGARPVEVSGALAGSDQANGDTAERPRTITIRSPHEVNATLLNALPAHLRAAMEPVVLRARRFEPTDRRRFQIDPASYGQTLSMSQAAETRVVSNLTQRGMTMTVLEPNLQTYTFGFRTRGATAHGGEGRADEHAWGPGLGIVYREREGARVAISDDHEGVSFELPYRRTVEILEGLIERPVTRGVAFAPAFELDSDGGRAVLRTARFVIRELAAQGSPPAPDPFGSTLQDLLIGALLARAPHSYSDRLAQPGGCAAPFNVKRAKDFMAAHADEPLTIAEIAAAAGCSVRALQSAFRTFDDGSPMQRLRLIRMAQAHRAIQEEGDAASVAEIAARYHFSNAGRFADRYRRMFGRPPSRDRRPGQD